MVRETRRADISLKGVYFGSKEYTDKISKANEIRDMDELINRLKEALNNVEEKYEIGREISIENINDLEKIMGRICYLTQKGV